MKKENIQDVIVFRPQGSKMAVEVKLKDETVWLTQAQIAILFGTKRPAITKHLRNILNSKELNEKSVCSILEHTAGDGKTYKTQHYNLDAIISIGYRVNSSRATQFRVWATSVLKQHLIQGYTINEKRLKEHADNIKQLQKTVEMLAELSRRKALTSDEATGLFEVNTELDSCFPGNKQSEVGLKELNRCEKRRSELFEEKNGIK